ncbi:MAG: hypothetical protein [Microviridae sp.]|nr:MAG: hypothetical protein [Microviridae sp.]
MTCSTSWRNIPFRLGALSPALGPASSIKKEARMADVKKDVTSDMPDKYPGIGLDRGDIFLDEFGREIPDPVPMAPPLGFRAAPTMAEIVRQQIMGERLRQEAAAMGKESWDEADDFDVGDDFDPSSPWEEQFDPVGYAPGALQRHEAAFQAAQATGVAPPAQAPSKGAPVAGTATPSAPGGAEGKPPKEAPPKPA